jgi:hypothetical protein
MKNTVHLPKRKRKAHVLFQLDHVEPLQEKLLRMIAVMKKYIIYQLQE